jgi:hypothetical protein
MLILCMSTTYMLIFMCVSTWLTAAFWSLLSWTFWAFPVYYTGQNFQGQEGFKNSCQEGSLIKQPLVI